LLLPSQCPAQVKLNVGDQSLVWDMQAMDDSGRVGSAIKWDMLSKTNPTPRHRAHREIHNLLRTLLPAGREEALKQLRCQCGDLGSARSTHRAMSWDQARQMASSDLIELGAHTVNHPWLSSLSLEEQRAEILGSKRVIEEQIQKTIRSFAYPYGTRTSYTAETIAILNELNFTNACANFGERISLRTNPFQIPRFLVRNWNGDEFMRQLRKGQL
jgi:peptidoglycan/xylan/chitin deacetylase (PgdA/CDA1 family)